MWNLLGSLGSALIGGAISANSQANANATNLQINRENNAANASLAKQQNDWNLDLWDRTNAYNTPKAQLDRIREAGLNPMWSGAGLTDSNASSLQSADLANQQAAQVSPEGFQRGAEIFSQGVSSAVQNYFQGRLVDSQVGLNQANENYLDNQSWLNSHLNSAQSDYFYSAAQLNRKNESWIDRLNQGNLNEQESRIGLNAANELLAHFNRSKTLTEKEFIEKQKQWYDSLTSSQIASLRSGASLNYASVNEIASMLPYKIQQAKGSIQQIAATTAGILLDNQYKTIEQKTKAFEDYILRTYGVKNNGGMFDNLFMTVAGALLQGQVSAGYNPAPVTIGPSYKNP